MIPAWPISTSFWKSAPEMTSGNGEGGLRAESWVLTPALGDISLTPADFRADGDVVTDLRPASQLHFVSPLSAEPGIG